MAPKVIPQLILKKRRIKVPVLVPVDQSEVTANNDRHDRLEHLRKGTTTTQEIIAVLVDTARRALNANSERDDVLDALRRATSTPEQTATFEHAHEARRYPDTPSQSESVQSIARRAARDGAIEHAQTETAKRATSLASFDAEFTMQSAGRRADNDSTLLHVVEPQPLRKSDTESYLRDDYQAYADNASADTWANPPNATDNDTGTAATLTATSSGLAGLTSNTTSDTLTLSFDPIPYGSGEVTSAVVIEIEREVAFSGGLALNQSASVSYEWRVDGGTWNVIATDDAAATKGFVSSAPATLTKAQIDNMEIQVVASVTSGSGSGANVQARVFRARRNFTAETVATAQPVNLSRADILMNNQDVTLSTTHY